MLVSRCSSELSGHKLEKKLKITGSERSRGICSPADTYWKRGYYTKTELSSRPERTRISSHAALETTACAAFGKESRIKFVNATDTNRKSGVAEWRDPRFLSILTQTLSIFERRFRILVIPFT